MYLPHHFTADDAAQVEAFVDAVGSADLVTFDGSKPVASLIPVIWDRSGGSPGRLLGHLARGNPQWKSVSPDTVALAIVHGPQAYVSPSWYPSTARHGKMVPTWNYVSVHFTGPLTVHRDPVPAIAQACTTLSRVPTTRRLVALYRLLDALVDSMFPFLASFDDRIDDLQDEIFVKPRQEQLSGLFALKRQLVDMRKLVTPQRDMVSSMLTQVIPIPGMTAETERYVRDLYDHLIRISDLVDSYRDLLGGSLEAYMSMVSNRLNDQMKQLTIIATVFLPLSFLTGFFGQNLGWLVNREGSLAAFLIFGVGTEVAAVLGLLVLFKKRGWM